LFASSQGVGVVEIALVQIIEQLNQIQIQLNNLQESIDISIQLSICQPIAKTFLEELIYPLDTIYDQLNKFYIQKLTDKEIARDHCKYINFNKIYQTFRNFVNDKTYVNKCVKPDPQSIQKWIELVTKNAGLFVYTVKGCEVASDKQTFFNYQQFKQELELTLQYYSSIVIPKVLVNGPNFKNEILNAVRDRNAQNAVDHLRSIYNYFHWHVIRYVAKKTGNRDDEYQRFALFPDNDLRTASACHAIHLNNRVVGRGWLQAIVMWCPIAAYPLNNGQIAIKNGSSFVFTNVDATVNANPGLDWSYVFGHDNGGVMIERAASDGEFRCDFVRYYTLCASVKKNFFMNEELLNTNSLLNFVR
jgi:hypothetical protein